MSTLDYSQVGAGFSDLAIGSQAVFRTVLQAMSRPGHIHEVTPGADIPQGVDAAACALLLALLDQDTSLWMSDSIAATPAGAYLRLHTGCRLDAHPHTSDFAWIGRASELPALDRFLQGTDEYPNLSCTCVIQVDALEDGFGWTLTGPGIANQAKLRAAGLPDAFAAQWMQNHSRFPCGVDAFLTAGHRVAGLPRTTQIKV